VRVDGEKNDCLIRQAFTETVLAILDATAFLTDDEDDAEVAIYAKAAATAQVQSFGRINKKLCSSIRIAEHLCAFPVHTRLQVLEPAIVLDKDSQVGVLVGKRPFNH
jgi:hypothetical protein